MKSRKRFLTFSSSANGRCNSSLPKRRYPRSKKMNLRRCRGWTMLPNPRNITQTGICKPLCRETNFRSGCITSISRRVLSLRSKAILSSISPWGSWSGQSARALTVVIAPHSCSFLSNWNARRCAPDSVSNGAARNCHRISRWKQNWRSRAWNCHLSKRLKTRPPLMPIFRPSTMQSPDRKTGALCRTFTLNSSVSPNL